MKMKQSRLIKRQRVSDNNLKTSRIPDFYSDRTTALIEVKSWKVKLFFTDLNTLEISSGRVVENICK